MIILINLTCQCLNYFLMDNFSSILQSIYGISWHFYKETSRQQKFFRTCNWCLYNIDVASLYCRYFTQLFHLWQTRQKEIACNHLKLQVSHSRKCVQTNFIAASNVALYLNISVCRIFCEFLWSKLFMFKSVERKMFFNSGTIS